MSTNIVVAEFDADKLVRTQALFQWNYGQILQFSGLDLPSTYTVHFSNQGVGGTAKPMLGNADGVDIPDEYLTTGKTVYAWVYLHAGDADGETVYAAIIPVIARPQPVEEEPTPVQQGLIERALTLLNAGVEDAQEAAGQAAQSATDAAASAAQATQDYSALSGEVTGLKSAVGETTGNVMISVTNLNQYIDLTQNSVNMNDGRPMPSGISASYGYAVVPCKAGDIFTINGTGGNQTRLWGFISSTGDVISKSEASMTGNNLIITAPDNSAFLVIHNQIANLKTSYKNQLLGSNVADLIGQIDSFCDLKRYSNLIVPDFMSKSINTSNSKRTVISDTIKVSAGKTYFGYATVDVSNLNGYTAGYLYLEFFHSLDFVLRGKIAGGNVQPLTNGTMELYGSFTPDSSGTVCAVLYTYNPITNYTCTVQVTRLYLIETEDNLAPLCASKPYENPIVDGMLKADTVGYDMLKSDVKALLPAQNSNIIDCWGDSLTDGAGSVDYPYPTKLQELVGSNYVVNNYGQGGEVAESVAFRQGGMLAIIEPFTASTSEVEMSSPTSVDGAFLGSLSYSGKYLGDNIVTIDGTKYFYRAVSRTRCKLSRVSGTSNPTYARPMLIVPEGKGTRHIMIVCVGQNGWVNTDNDALIGVIQNMIDHNDYDKYLVLGIPTGDSNTKEAQEQALGAVFGTHFINTREYVSTWGLSDNDLTPTAEDTTAMEAGAIPPTLKSDSIHLNDYGYIAMANCVYARGKALGYWD